MKTAFVLAASIAAILLTASAGCSSRSKLPVYNPSQVGTVMTTQRGEITAVRDVIIKPAPQSGAGAGSVIGAGVGRSATTGYPGAMGGAVGAVIGAAVGAKTDEQMGEELTIMVEGGQTIVIVQERGDPPFAPGEKIQVITSAPATGYPGGGYPGGVWGGRGGSGFPTGGIAGGNTRVVRDQRFATSSPEQF